MDSLQTMVLIAHTVIALLIIVLVLMQRGKGADAGAAFGSGASGTVFGARGSSNFFSRTTAILAAAFFVSSLSLAYISSQRTDAPDSLIESGIINDIAEPNDTTGDETTIVPELPNTTLMPLDDELPELQISEDNKDIENN
ncbi:MAG: preprotein translocase subunit SecG [Gammaproteobacteria bacterium]|nr:preprotein translocase subunit SecG [Gammaproteobacteria bacterium]